MRDNFATIADVGAKNQNKYHCRHLTVRMCTVQSRVFIYLWMLGGSGRATYGGHLVPTSVAAFRGKVYFNISFAALARSPCIFPLPGPALAFLCHSFVPLFSPLPSLYSFFSLFLTIVFSFFFLFLYTRRRVLFRSLFSVFLLLSSRSHLLLLLKPFFDISFFVCVFSWDLRALENK